MKKDRNEKGNAQFYIIMLIVFVLFAGGAYFAFSSYQEHKEKLAHEETLRQEDIRRKNEEFRLASERKKAEAENAEKKRVFDSAAAFANANLDSPQTALKRLAEAGAKLKGTEYEALVNAEIENIKAAAAEKNAERKRRIEELLCELDKKADELAKDKLYKKAVSFLNDYDGKFRRETSAQREKMALKYEKLQMEHEEMEKKAQKTIADISSIIADGDFQKAYEKLEAASADKALEQYRDEINSLKKSLEKVKNLDKEIQAYFESKLNTETTIKTGNKQKFEGTVSSVDKTYVELKIKMGKASASKKIQYSAIPLSEKMRILKEIDETASNLMLYAAALKKSDFKRASDCTFSAAGTFGKELDQHIQKKIDSASETPKDNVKKSDESDATDEEALQTALDKNTIKGLKVKAIVQKPSTGSGSDYDNRYQLVKSRISISNEALADVSGLEGEIYVIGKSVNGSKDYRLFKIAKTSDIAVAKGKKYTSEEHTCRVEYDSNDYAKFGHKYDGYLLVLKDSSGNLIMKKGNPARFEKIADKIMKLEENSIFNDDGNFIEMYRYRY